MDSSINERLLVHAGLSWAGEVPPGRGFLAVMDLLLKDRSSNRQLWDEVRDVLDCLRVINEELNGRPPTEMSWQDKVQHLDRLCVYALHLILHRTRTVALEPPDSATPAVIEEIGKTGWVMSAAIDGVLAGDFDDLDEEVADEARARGMDLDLWP